MRTAVLLSPLLASALLSACGEKSTDATPSPSQLAAARAAEEFKGYAPFTLDCSGNYSWTNDGKTNSGTQSFSISVSPQQGVVYVFGFDANGFLDRTHREMNNEVRKITSVSEEAVEVGELSLDRKTGKYKYSVTTAGLCSKAAQHVPIPTRKF